MSANEALDILYTAARLAPMTARDHEVCAEAYKILRTLLENNNKNNNREVGDAGRD